MRCEVCSKGLVCKYKDLFKQYNLEIEEQVKNNVLYVECNEFDDMMDDF